MHMSLLGTELHHIRHTQLLPQLQIALSHADRSVAEQEEGDSWKHGADEDEVSA